MVSTRRDLAIRRGESPRGRDGGKMHVQMCAKDSRAGPGAAGHVGREEGGRRGCRGELVRLFRGRIA